MTQNQISAVDPTHEIDELCQLAIKNSFVADALAMPVHWYYRVSDIYKSFPTGINQFYAAPEKHPSSIMSLHSKQHGGRQPSNHKATHSAVSIVGDVILKGKQSYWKQSNVHYHQGMQAGENTLNAHTVLWLLQAIHAADNLYQEASFLDLYIANMTSEIPTHPDTYAESYHRGFFANLHQGKAANQCAAVTHDTPSIGGLVRIGPLVLFLIQQGYDVAECKSVAAMHLKLTHPDAQLTQVCFQFIDLIAALINAEAFTERKQLIAQHLNQTAGRHFKHKPASEWVDNQILGGLFSTACYISDSWPSVLYLACKYPDDSLKALQVNAESGGDNVHRGSVLAILLSLLNRQSLDPYFSQLQRSDTVKCVLNQLFNSKAVSHEH